MGRWWTTLWSAVRLLNHGEPFAEMPKLTDFDQSLQDYKAQVEAEIAQEAADAGMNRGGICGGWL